MTFCPLGLHSQVGCKLCAVPVNSGFHSSLQNQATFLFGRMTKNYRGPFTTKERRGGEGGTQTGAPMHVRSQEWADNSSKLLVLMSRPNRLNLFFVFFLHCHTFTDRFSRFVSVCTTIVLCVNIDTHIKHQAVLCILAHILVF